MPLKTRDNKMWSFSRSSDQVHAGLACDGSWFTLSRHAYVSVTTLYRKNYAHWSLLQEEMNSGGPCITTIRHSVDVTLSSLLMLDSTLMTHHQALSNTMVNMHLVWAGDWIRKFDLDCKSVNTKLSPIWEFIQQARRKSRSMCYQPVHVCKSSINIYGFKVYLTNEERIVDCRELDIKTMKTFSL